MCSAVLVNRMLNHNCRQCSAYGMLYSSSSPIMIGVEDGMLGVWDGEVGSNGFLNAGGNVALPEGAFWLLVAGRL